MFAADNALDFELQVVDLFTSGQVIPSSLANNRACRVPMFEDGDFLFTESLAIPTCPADKMGSPAYPENQRQWGWVNERMDRLNAQLYCEFGFGSVYPQVFQQLKRSNDKQQGGYIAWSDEPVAPLRQVFDKRLIDGPATCACAATTSRLPTYGGGLRDG